jgi:predicted MPP superfamily phosphohydrolase
MRFQIASDLHLEISKVDFNELLNPTAKYLILAGDIGNPSKIHYREFIEYCSKNWKMIFLITGNHEYYLNSINETHEYILDIIIDFQNVKFLNNSSYNLNNKIMLYGCTLWSNIINDEKDIIYRTLNDFRYIKNMTINNYLKLHNEHVNNLKEFIEKDYTSIIITHHLPTYKLIHDKYKNSNINSVFCSDLEYLMKDNIKYWICGHSHSSMSVEINNCKCLLNPRGYYNENQEYKNDYVIKI